MYKVPPELAAKLGQERMGSGAALAMEGEIRERSRAFWLYGEGKGEKRSTNT